MAPKKKTTSIKDNTQQWLTQTVFGRVNRAHLLLAGIVAFSLGLHLYNISSIGDANTYYTAAVEAMLQSWKNFFFVAAEPGGSVTVDKPPLGLWTEAISAYFFGVNGFAVSLPNILAGLASIVVVFHLVKKYFGEGAGLLAAVVMAVTPVLLAADRNNTMDSQLVFVLLLAAWAVIAAVERGQVRYLLLGAFLVGLGFNIKMLQAYLVLPALYALYFFAADKGWGRKLLELGLATAVLLVVSLSWAVAVDLTPADQRPYIGSSTDNSVMELIVGHNGLNRLFGGGGGGGGQGGPAPAADGGQGLPDGGPADGQGLPPRGDGNGGPRPDGGPNQGQGQGGVPFANETGQPGALRLFEAPLAKEMGWLLPFALVGLGLLAFSEPLHFPIRSRAQQAALLWGGWLLTCLAFFSLAEFFHAYYMVMLVPPLGALVGMGTVQLWRLAQTRRGLAAGLLLGTAAVTLAFQMLLANSFSVSGWWLGLPVLSLLVGAALLLMAHSQPERWGKALRLGFAASILAVLIIPAAWSALTVSLGNGNINLPAAYSGGDGQGNQRAGEGSRLDAELVDYLQANTEGMTYMLAVASANVGSPYVLETGRGVLYLGGFNGGDQVIDAEGLADLVDANELRYVMLGGERNRGGGNQQGGLSGWLQSSCSVVAEYSQLSVASVGDDGPQGQSQQVLYDCAN